jgi:outer membrane receptor protein involved in Fe transport
MPYSPKLSWTATAEYAFSTAGGLNGQVGAALRWVGKRLNDTTERQRVTAAGDPDTLLLPDEITMPLELDSYRALDLYAGIGKGNWELRAYANNVTGEQAWSTLAPMDGALSGARSHLAGVPIQPRAFGLEIDFRF